MHAAAAEAKERAEVAKDCERRLARMQEDCMQRLKSAARKAERRCTSHAAFHAARPCTWTFHGDFMLTRPPA